MLGCSDWFDEAARLMDACYETYDMARVLAPAMSAGQMPVTNGKKDVCSMCVMEEMSVPLSKGEQAQIVLDVPKSVPAPVYPGMHLGTAKLVADGMVYARSEVVAGERVDTNGIYLDVRRIMACWIL